MTVHVELIDEFEAARPRLLSLAHRILGSAEDAEDAVQTAWLRAHSSSQTRIDNPTAWFTTITARLCLDQLRSRERRGELPLLAETIAGDQLAADEELLQREAVSRALLVLLDQLTPAQRVAYVLHDLFRMPFDDVAAVLDTSSTNAKKLASRARRRLVGPAASTAEAPQSAHHWRIVEAFLSAARRGEIETLIELMAPDVVRTADPRVLPEGGAVRVVGDRAVAEETRHFADRVHASIPMLVNGVPAAIIAPGGHPLATITFDLDGGSIIRIEIARLEPGDRLRPPPATIVPDRPVAPELPG